jgi:hypothetical protein
VAWLCIGISAELAAGEIWDMACSVPGCAGNHLVPRPSRAPRPWANAAIIALPSLSMEMPADSVFHSQALCGFATREEAADPTDST